MIGFELKPTEVVSETGHHTVAEVRVAQCRRRWTVRQFAWIPKSSATLKVVHRRGDDRSIAAIAPEVTPLRSAVLRLADAQGIAGRGGEGQIGASHREFTRGSPTTVTSAKQSMVQRSRPAATSRCTTPKAAHPQIALRIPA